MIEFERTINQSECEAGYLNLTDVQGKSHGREFGLAHLAPVAIVGTSGQVTFAQKHKNNQIWGTLSHWYKAENVVPGSRIRVRFDPAERHEGLPVIHLITEAVGTIVPPDTSGEQVVYASEIPLSLERQLEDFLATNLSLIEPGLTIFQDEGGGVGRQYPTDVGVIDLLCKRANGELLVIELKKSRVSDVVVGQISRYLGWVKKHIANGEQVKGLILSHKADEKLGYAVSAHPALSLRYFKLKLVLVSEDEVERIESA
jgi:hypothetical protein